jgi:putative GTP pyrophosphokinase
VSLSKEVEACKLYEKRRAVYEELAKKVETIIKENLKINDADFHSVSSRVKTVQSYREKAKREKYKDPHSEIMDMAGVRVITYTDSEAIKVAEIVKKAFRIYPKYSINKSEQLGIDKLGYRGIHFIADLGETRLQLPENSIFLNYLFEIQVRSILQHAWAEFEHDRNYKFAGELPSKIKRRLNIAAGNLESIDMEFDRLSNEIDNYKKEVENRTLKGELTIPIDTTSLIAYVNEKFKEMIIKGILELKIYSSKNMIDELAVMGINSLDQLDKIIPNDFAEKAEKYYKRMVNRMGGGTSIDGIIIDILILNNATAYFEKAWKNKWRGIEQESVGLICSYGIDFTEFIEKYDLNEI